VDDVIVDELHALFTAAADEFEVIKRDDGKRYDEIIAAATRVRDAALVWARYVEATAKAPEKSIPGGIDAILRQRQTRPN
jgi:hypothetical protein